MGVDAASCTATGAWSVLMIMSSSSGVVDVSLVVRSTRYCTYCECAVNAPGADRRLKALQLVSGVRLFQVMVAQSTGLLASKTRDRNDPEAAYGVIRIQSTNTTPPEALKSLAASGRIGPLTVSGSLWTSAPSTE